MLALALILAVAPSQDTLRYSFTIDQQQDIDMAAMGGGTMQQVLGLSGRITLTLRDTIGGQVASIRIDTAAVASENPMLASMMAVPSGYRLETLMLDDEDPRGLDDDEADEEDVSMGVVLLTDAMGMLMLRWPDDLEVGRSWSDTTVSDSSMAAEGVTSRSVIDWQVSSREGTSVVLDGVEATTVAMTMDGSSTGGTSTGTRRVVLGSGDSLVLAESSSAGDIQMLVDNMALTIRQRTTTRLARLP